MAECLTNFPLGTLSCSIDFYFNKKRLTSLFSCRSYLSYTISRVFKTCNKSYLIDTLPNNYFRLSKKLVVIRWFEDYLEQRCKLFIHKNSAERWKGKGDKENERHRNGKQKTSSDRQWRPVFLHYSMPRNTHMLACLILCLRWHLASSYILMMRYFYTYFKRITRMSCPMPIAICIPFCTWILALGKQTVTVKKTFLLQFTFEKM